MTTFLQKLPEVLENNVLEYAGQGPVGAQQLTEKEASLPAPFGKIKLRNGTYMENHPNHPEGEMSISHIGMNQLYPHVIGNKFPPCFLPNLDVNNKKKWIEYYD